MSENPEIIDDGEEQLPPSDTDQKSPELPKMEFPKDRPWQQYPDGLDEA